MNFREFEKRISGEKVESAYFFTGHEDFLVRQAKRLIKEHFFGDGGGDIHIYEGPETPDLSGFLSEARTPSLLAPRRILILEEPEAVKSIKKESLISYLDEPSRDVCVVFIMKKADMRRELPKLLKKKCVHVEMKPPKGKHLQNWIKSYLAAGKYRITGDAAALLTERLGDNLFRLAGEMDKLILYAGEDRTITFEHLELTTRSRSHEIFEITDAIGARNPDRAFGILKNMMEDGAEPIADILPMLRWKFRQLQKAKAARRAGKSEGEILKAAKVPPFFKERFLRQLKSYREEEIESFFPHFMKADMALKRSSVDKKLIMERLFMDLCDK